MNQIISIMTGTVARIDVGVGDFVEEQSEVIVLESMKMLIPLESEKKGKIIQVHVSIGDFVNEGDVLFTLE